MERRRRTDRESSFRNYRWKVVLAVEGKIYCPDRKTAKMGNPKGQRIPHLGRSFLSHFLYLFGLSFSFFPFSSFLIAFKWRRVE